jgi:hypothetical protein
LSPAVSVEPPPLPKPHVSRGGAFPPLLRLLKLNPVVAVVGYPKLGKTIALAEFARKHYESPIWLTVPDSAASSEEWPDLAAFHIGQHLGSPTVDRAAVQSALIAHAETRSVLIVLDDAHLIKDFRSLTFLEQAAGAANGRLHVLLAGIDRPSFLEHLRGSGCVSWRLPGFTEKQAEMLCQQIAGPLSRWQKTALALVLARTHGHPGMLHLAHGEIRSIQSRRGIQQFCQAFSSELGPGLEAFQAGLVQRFRAGLSAEEAELCRRLAIALGPFQRRLAQALWCVERAAPDFPAAWAGCLLRAFEAQPRGRYTLPELYKQGLLAYSIQSERARWHAAAADELSQPVGDMLSVLDDPDTGCPC